VAQLSTAPSAKISIEASENDLKRLMADVSRAMEKAQEAITRIASNSAVTATETKRAHS
jgi:hypothetical protein